MKLVSLNLQGVVDWQERQPRVAKYLEAEQPDIIFFQEVVYLPSITPQNRVQLLNEQLGFEFENSAVTRLQPSPHYDVFREGLAILSRYPILKSSTIVLKQQPGDEHNRIVQFIDVKIGDEIVKLANVHFSLTDGQDFATAHLLELLEILDSLGEERIIAGDFNMEHLDQLSEYWQAKYRASTVFKYVSSIPDSRQIDHVLIPKQYVFTKFNVSGDGLSDHRALSVAIESSSL